MSSSSKPRTEMEVRKLRIKLEAKEKYLIQNGAILLEKQMALSQGQVRGVQSLKIYSAKEIKRATKNFDPGLLIGNAIFATFHRGDLDGRTVAVKTQQRLAREEEMIDLFLNEASMAQVITHSHKNMVKIYGCCLETRVPIVVCEYMPNRTLFVHLHGDPFKKDHLRIMSWPERLTAAIDVAYALSFMHNALPKPIVHRDIQSFSILLDESYRAKLGYFGSSVSVTQEEPTHRWPVAGPPGYIDPEYIETQKVTDKCDVYSFGVLMLELLTRKQPRLMQLSGLDLVDEVVSAVNQNRMKQITDELVLEEASSDELKKFVDIALKCVAKAGKERPSMIEVVNELRRIGSTTSCQ